MQPSIDLVVAGEPLEVRAYPHPNGKSVSISLNAARGCVWRALVYVRDGLECADAGNDRALVFAALGDELKSMRWQYGVTGVVGGAILGYALARLIA